MKFQARGGSKCRFKVARYFARVHLRVAVSNGVTTEWMRHS
jgi:hypothetical protein